MTTVSEMIRGQELARLPSDSTIREAARYMVERGVGSVLVMDEAGLRGIFTERDALKIFVATRRNADHTRLADVMTEAPQTLSPDTSPPTIGVTGSTAKRVVPITPLRSS